jgi:beta-glucanase (GH16 family)
VDGVFYASAAPGANFYDPQAFPVYFPAGLGTGNAPENTDSANNVPIRNDWVEFGLTVPGSCTYTALTDITTEGLVTQSVNNVDCDALLSDSFLVTLNTTAWAGCSLGPRQLNTWPTAASITASISGSVVSITWDDTPIADGTNYTASWQLSCPQVRGGCGGAWHHPWCCAAGVRG